MSIKYAARTKDNFVTVEIMSDTVFILHVQNNITSLFIIDYVVSVLKLFVLRLSKSVAIPGATRFGAEFFTPACLYNLFIVSNQFSNETFVSMNTNKLFRVGLWCCVFVCVYSQSEIPIRPLILVPGFAASILQAKKDEQTTRVYETYPNSDNIMKEFLWCRYNTTTQLATSFKKEHTISPPTDNFGLYAVTDLNPPPYYNQSDTPHRPYFNDLIAFLTSIGYVPGKTLFAFPYDWRQSTVKIAEELKLKIKSILTDKITQVDIIAHSMGGLVTKASLVHSHQYIHRLISIGTPYRSSGAGWAASVLVGSQLNNPNLSRETVLKMLLNSPSTYDGIYESLEAEKEGISTTLFSYVKDGLTYTVKSAREALELVEQALAKYSLVYDSTVYPLPLNSNILYSVAKQGYEQRKQGEQIQYQPNRFFSVIGVLQETPTHVTLPTSITEPSQLILQEPRYSDLVSGDGAVTQWSASGDRFTTCSTCRVTIPNTHNGLLYDPYTMKSLRHFLGLSCKWDGIWNVTIMKSNTFQEPIQLVQDGWSVSSETYSMRGNVWDNELRGTLVGEYGLAQFTWTMNNECTTFNGSWRYDWQAEYYWTGTRQQGSECKNGDQQSCSIMNGNGVRDCVYGYWSGTCEIVSCNSGFANVNSTCMRYQSTYQFGTRSIVVFPMILGVLIVMILFLLGHWKASKQVPPQERNLTMTDVQDDEIV
jgi:pimeloyl-ACP methyl ester carboxylesterase